MTDDIRQRLRAIADFIAINAWPSRGFEIIGYEVKVSRTDWVREQQRPEKAERFWRHCHQWSLIVPAPADTIVKPGELPHTWGLCEVQENGKIKQLTPAPRKTPEPLPWSWSVGWMSQLSRLQTRVDDKALQEAYQRGCDKTREAAKNQFAADDGRLRDQLRKLGLGAHDWISDEDAKLFKEIRSQRDANLRLRWATNGIKQAIQSLEELSEIVEKMGPQNEC